MAHPQPTDIGLIVAIVGSSLGFIVVTISMFLWIRTEANADRRHFNDIQEKDRRDILRMEKHIEKMLRRK